MMRLGAPADLGVVHCSDSDTTLRGGQFFVPKDTQIMLNIGAVHRWAYFGPYLLPLTVNSGIT